MEAVDWMSQCKFKYLLLISKIINISLIIEVIMFDWMVNQH